MLVILEVWRDLRRLSHRVLTLLSAMALMTLMTLAGKFVLFRGF